MSGTGMGIFAFVPRSLQVIQFQNSLPFTEVNSINLILSKTVFPEKSENHEVQSQSEKRRIDR